MKKFGKRQVSRIHVGAAFTEVFCESHKIVDTMFSQNVNGESWECLFIKEVSKSADFSGVYQGKAQTLTSFTFA